MGQAKQRGTFEERKDAAIRREIEKEGFEKRLALAKERSMTPQQRLERHKQTLARIEIAGMLAVLAGR